MRSPLASLTRRMLWAYVGMVAFFVLWGISNAYISDLDHDGLAALSDPFGLNALALATRYWSPADRNHLLVGLDRWIIMNRLVWLGIAGIVALWTAWRFKMGAPEIGSSRRVQSSKETPAVLSFDPLPRATQTFAGWAAFTQFWHQLRVELKVIFRSAPFIVIVLLIVAQVMGNAFGTANRIFGTPVLPVTHLMTRVIGTSTSLHLVWSPPTSMPTF